MPSVTWEPLNLPLIGRKKELNLLLSELNKVQTGHGARIILISGESGIGKSKLAEDMINFSQQIGIRILRSRCANESVTPYLPIFEALRSGDMAELVSFDKPPRIEFATMMNPDGLVISKQNRSDSDLDMDIFSGMLSAVSSFVKDSMGRLVNEEESDGGLNSMGYGEYRILIESRSYGSLVVVVSGNPTEILMSDIGAVMQSIGMEYGDELAEWNGEIGKFPNIQENIISLTRKYDGEDFVVEPQDRQWRLFENVAKGISRNSKEKPLLMFIDDLHWADASSLSLLQAIMKRCKEDKFILLGSYRKEELKSSGGETSDLGKFISNMGSEDILFKLELQSLLAEDARTLVSKALGNEVQEDLMSLLIDEGEGNPFFILELIKYLKEEDKVELQDGKWTSTSSIGSIGLPDRVKDILINQLEKLPEEYRDFLECSAVMGELFSPDIVSCTLKLEKIKMLKMLRNIQRDFGIISESFDEGYFAFDDDRVREILYTQLPKELRKEYHRLLAGCLSARVEEGNTEVYPELAKHSFLGKHELAGSYCLRAGEWAMEDFNISLAKECLNWSWELAKEEGRAEVAKALAEACFLEGNHEEADYWFKTALENTSDPSMEIIITSRLARVLERLSKEKESLELLKAHTPGPDVETVSRAKWRSTKAWIHFRQMDYDHAEEEAAWAINEFSEAGGEPSDIGFCWTILGSVKYGLGDYNRAAELYQKGIDICQDPRSLHQKLSLMNNLALCERARGKLDDSIQLAEEAYSLSEKIGNRFYEGVSLDRIGHSLLYKGSFQEAETKLNKGIDLAWEIAANWLIADMLQLRARCNLYNGNSKQALRDIDESLVVSGESFDIKMYTTVVQVEVLNEIEECNEALEVGQEMIGKLSKKGSKNVLAIVHRNLARTYAKLGRVQQAEQEFQISLIESRSRIESFEYALGLKWWGEHLLKTGDSVQAKQKLIEARGHFEGMGAIREQGSVDLLLRRLD